MLTPNSKESSVSRRTRNLKEHEEWFFSFQILLLFCMPCDTIANVSVSPFFNDRSLLYFSGMHLIFLHWRTPREHQTNKSSTKHSWFIQYIKGVEERTTLQDPNKFMEKMFLVKTVITMQVWQFIVWDDGFHELNAVIKCAASNVTQSFTFL